MCPINVALNLCWLPFGWNCRNWFEGLHSNSFFSRIALYVYWCKHILYNIMHSFTVLQTKQSNNNHCSAFPPFKITGYTCTFHSYKLIIMNYYAYSFIVSLQTSAGPGNHHSILQDISNRIQNDIADMSYAYNQLKKKNERNKEEAELKLL